MADLIRKPQGTAGKIHDLTPQTAHWTYVGFALHRLTAGQSVQEMTGNREVILVLVEGRADIDAAGTSWGEMGDRMTVWERTPPHCLMCRMTVPGR